MEDFRKKLLSDIYCAKCKTNIINRGCNCKFVIHTNNDYINAIWFYIDNFSVTIELKDNSRFWMGVNLQYNTKNLLNPLLDYSFRYIEEKDFNSLVDKIQNAINVTYHTKINLLFI